MLSRPQLCCLADRVQELAAEVHADPVAGELGALALQLLAALEQTRATELLLRTSLTELVAACRASVAADHLGYPSPLVHVEHQLAAHGWAPGPNARPTALLAATADLRTLLTCDNAR